MSNKPFTTHGAFSWAQLATSDPQAACEFYRQLFGWTFRTNAVPMPYHVIKNDKNNERDDRDDRGMGGIMAMPLDMHAKKIPPHWGC